MTPREHEAPMGAELGVYTLLRPLQTQREFKKFYNVVKKNLSTLHSSKTFANFEGVRAAQATINRGLLVYTLLRPLQTRTATSNLRFTTSSKTGLHSSKTFANLKRKTDKNSPRYSQLSRQVYTLLRPLQTVHFFAPFGK